MGNQHPNGGEDRPLPVNHGKMPTKMGAKLPKHTDLAVPGEGDPRVNGPNSPGRMPKRMSGGRQHIPRRR